MKCEYCQGNGSTVHALGEETCRRCKGNGYIAAAPTQGADARPANILGPDKDGLPIARYSYQTGIGLVEHCNGTYVRYGEIEQRLRSFKGPEDARPVAIYQIERLAREIEVECLAGSGVSFYMAAEMAIERTIEMLAGPSMQIAEVCQDADGFKHIESVIEDLDDIPAGTRLCATHASATGDVNNRVAKGLENCDWSGVPIGNKAIIQHAIDLLRTDTSMEDAQRFQWVTYVAENANILHTVVLCHEGDQDKINERIHSYRAAIAPMEKT